MQTLAPAASKIVDPIEQAHGAITPGDSEDDESWLVHSSKPSAGLFGESLVSRMRSVTSSLDDWRRGVESSARHVYARGADRVDQAILRVRQLGAALVDRIRERWNSLSARADDDRRVSPVTQPK